MLDADGDVAARGKNGRQKRVLGEFDLRLRRWIAPQRCAARLADARERWSELRANTRNTNRNTNNRDGRASTRRESGKLRVLIVVATAYT
jgi:hypothetical protein